MTIREIEKQLPQGFHDANLESFEFDLRNMAVRLYFNILIEYNERDSKTIYRRGEVLVKNVSFLAASPYIAIPKGRAVGTVFSVSTELPDNSIVPSELVKGAKFLTNLYIGDAPSFFDLSVGYESAEFMWTGEDVSY